MPLVKSGSKEAMSENISREVRAGKPTKQAVAIAYSVKRKAGGQPGPSANHVQTPNDRKALERRKAR